MFSKPLRFVCISLLGAMAVISFPLAGYADQYIMVNEVGYLPDSPKAAYLVNPDSTAQRVDVINNENGEVMMTLPLLESRWDASLGQSVTDIDLSGFDRIGKFKLRCGPLESPPFTVSPQAYDSLLSTAARSFYLRECGVEVKDSVTGIGHSACHKSDAVVDDPGGKNDGGEVKTTGGWHDGYDYDKYVTSGAIAVGNLLSIYEHDNHVLTRINLHLPLAADTIPDILNLCRVELEWLLTMQRPDGLVYRKVFGKKSPAKSPEDDEQARFLGKISTAETAQFAAVMAMAARIYKPYDSLFAARCLASGLQGWTGMAVVVQDLTHPGTDTDGDQYASPRGYEEYRDVGSRIWGAAELYLVTRNPEFLYYLNNNFNRMDFNPFSWTDPAAQGMMDIIEQGGNDPEVIVVKNAFKSRFDMRVNQLVSTLSHTGFGCTITEWNDGSATTIAENGITLLHAYRLTRNPLFLHGALSQLDYLLGCNPLNHSFVTGFGSHPVEHPAAAWRSAEIPGLLVSGPNSHPTDGITPADKGAQSYVDNEDAFSCNRNTIEFNASFTTLVALVIAQQQ